jgi:hypothetical protein
LLAVDGSANTLAISNHQRTRRQPIIMSIVRAAVKREVKRPKFRKAIPCRIGIIWGEFGITLINTAI